MSMADILTIGDLGGWAAVYAQAGLDVFPLRPDKTPYVSQHKATTEASVVAAWWEQWPQALIGHRIDPRFVLLDIDPRHGGFDTWQALKAVIGDLPATRVHASGRGDGGAHFWFLRPADEIHIRGLHQWARDSGVGEDLGGGRWSCGIDLLQHDHRYTILPPSPHAETAKPYQWLDGRTFTHDVAPMPALLAELITATPEPASTAPAPPRTDAGMVGDSIADWYSLTHPWTALLPAHGWTLIAGNGDEDGSRWRHPAATSAYSATVRHGLLFVYSTSTAFEPTDAGDTHGYTPFRAYATLDHQGDMKAAASAARATKGPNDPDIAWVEAQANAQPLLNPETFDMYVDPDLDEFLDTDDPPYEWLVEGLIERGDRIILTGQEGMGKSTLLRQIAVQLASGIHPFTLEPIEPLQVLIVDCENSPRQARRALTGLRATAEDAYNKGKLRLRILGHSQELADPKIEADIGARIDAQGVDVLVIGPLYKLIDDDPVKEMPAKAVANAIDRLRQKRDSAVVIEAHSPYPDGARTKRLIRPYGASLWSRWPEFGLHLAPEGQLEHWRGQRDERSWPAALERAQPWPWGVKEGAEEAREWHGPTECMAAVVSLVDELDRELSPRKIGEELRARGSSFRDQTIRDACRMAANQKRLSHRFGPRNSDLYGPRSLDERAANDLSF